MSGIILKIIGTASVIGILIFLWLVGRKKNIHHQELIRANNLLESKVIELTANLEHEIDARKQVEDRLPQQKKLQGVIEMTGSVCHELNQPLQILLGYSEMLMSDLEEDHPTYAKMATIIQQTDRMKTITQRLMSVARYETVDFLDNQIIDTNNTPH